MGFGLGTLGTLKGCGKLGLSRLQVKLQFLVLRHESVELLLHLADLSPKFLSLGALRGRFLFGLGQRLLEGRHLSCGPYNSRVNPITFCNCTFHIFQ